MPGPGGMLPRSSRIEAGFVSATDKLVEIVFGRDGSDRYHLGAGWSGDEPGYRWSTGPSSELWLDNPGDEMDYVLELNLSPFIHPPALPAQRLAVFVRGALIGRAQLDDLQTLAYRIPAAAFMGQGPVRVTFEHPDAASPQEHGINADSRQLGFSFRRMALSPLAEAADPARIEGGETVVAADIGRLTGVPAAQFVLRFESLGDNCEFGLVQRRCGAEPLGLLRFSNITVPQLLRGLDNGFDGLGDPANMDFWLHATGNPEYVVRDKSYGLVFHTFLHPGDVVESELIAQQSTRLRFLRRKFLEDLAAGEKIFVLKRNDPLGQAEVLAVLAALRRHSATAQLLYVLPTTADHPPGTVERAADGLLCGYIDRFAPPERVPDLSLEPWLAVCVNAARLTQGSAQPESAG